MQLITDKEVNRSEGPLHDRLSCCPDGQEYKAMIKKSKLTGSQDSAVFWATSVAQ